MKENEIDLGKNRIGIIEFTEGGVGVLETLLTGGIAIIVQEALDKLTGDSNHGWYCIISEKTSELNISCWGATKYEAKERTENAIRNKIKDLDEEEQERKEYQLQKQKEEAEQKLKLQRAEQQRRIQQTSSTDTSDGENNSGCGIAIVVLIVAAVIIWFVFSVAIPFVLINMATVALVAGLIKKDWNKFLFPLSGIGVIYLILDYNNGWATKALVGNVSFFKDFIPAFFYINILAGLVAVYFIIRNYLDEKKPQIVSGGEFSKRNMIVMGCLLVVGGLTIGLQNQLGTKIKGSQTQILSSDNTKTMRMIFIGYNEGDLMHLIFKNIETGEEYDFGNEIDEKKFNNIKILLEDDDAMFGYKANPIYLNKEFTIKATYRTVLTSDPISGKAINMEAWVIDDLRQEKIGNSPKTSNSSNNLSTPGGYKYVKHHTSNGIKPKPGDYAYFYIDLLYDDSLVLSSRKQGQKIPLEVPELAKLKEDMEKGKPNPVAEAAAVMREGDSITLIIPVDEKLKRNPALANVKNLVHHMVLIEVQTKAEYDSNLAAEHKLKREKQTTLAARVPEVKSLVDEKVKQYSSGGLKSTVQTTSSGLKYLILESGAGKKAAAQQPVQVQYYGVLKDGKMFDNSFERGIPYSFRLGVGAVIPGWDEGIALLKEGGKAFLFVPPAMAYGEQGNGKIPPNSELIFYIELEKVGN